MAVVYITRIFRRATDEFWWHWRDDCTMWKTAWSKKKRGKTFVYLTITNGGRPSTFGHCPGCTAIDLRIATKATPYKKPAPTRKTIIMNKVGPVTRFGGWNVGYQYL